MSSKDIVLQAETRAEYGNGPARRTRRAGRVPGVIYGHGAKGTPISLDAKALLGVIHHPGLVKIDVAGKQSTGIIKEVQRNHVTGGLLHVDIQEVRPDEIITTTVEIEATGTPAGAVQGGQLEQVMRHAEVKLQAQHLFETLTVDVSGMQLNDVMKLGKLPLPEGATMLGDLEQAVFHVRLPKMEETAAAEGEAAEAGAEPEVIAKGKKEEEGAAGGEKKEEKGAAEKKEKK